jgi:hypothetical protein
MKTINTEKLRAMGLEKARAACLVHAEKALAYRAQGNERLADRHINLLDQCAAIGRSLNGSTNNPSARGAIHAVESM